MEVGDGSVVMLDSPHEVEVALQVSGSAEQCNIVGEEPIDVTSKEVHNNSPMGSEVVLVMEVEPVIGSTQTELNDGAERTVIIPIIYLHTSLDL